MTWICAANFVSFDQQHGAWRENRDRIADAAPVMSRPVRVDPVGGHDNEIRAIGYCEIDDFLGSVSVNDELLGSQPLTLKSLRKFLQAFAGTLFHPIVEMFHLVECNVFDGLDDVQQQHVSARLSCEFIREINGGKRLLSQIDGYKNPLKHFRYPPGHEFDERHCVFELRA